MARPKRIDLPHSLYHVMSRTNSGDVAFLNSKDEMKFLSYVKKYVNIFDFRVHAWCLMPNHFHLLLESTNRPALSEFMRRLLTAYTVWYNRRCIRHGHLFQGRFKSYIVDKADYLLALSRYVHLNPVESGITDRPESYRGSSLKHYLSGDEPEFLYTKEILSYFGGSRKDYAVFIMEGLNEKTKPDIVRQSYIGEKRFVKRIQKRLKYLEFQGSQADRANRKQDQILREGELAKAKEITKVTAAYFNLTPNIVKKSRKARGDIGKARTIIIFLLREYLPWTCREITGYMGLKEKRGIDYYCSRIAKDRGMQMIVSDIIKLLRINGACGGV